MTRRNIMQVGMKADTTILDTLLAGGDRVAVESVIEKAIERLQDIINSNWSQTSPSAPFTPPAQVTGFLAASQKIERRGALGRFTSAGNAIQFALVFQADYAAALEYGNPATGAAPRPFIAPAMYRLSKEFPTLFRQNLKFTNRRSMNKMRWLSELS